MKKVIAFDQDDTINITKLPIDSEMANLLVRLLDHFIVCIISGTSWDVMKKNDIDTLVALDGEVNWSNYLIMPTSGMQFWRFVGDSEVSLDDSQIIEDGWKREYAHFLSGKQIVKISQTLEDASRKLGYWCESPSGEIIENRGSQVTFSALGQNATPEEKYNWDLYVIKRKAIVELAESELSELGVQIGIGGATSIDVTLPGIDKAYGMRCLMEQTGLKKEDILFIGDKLQPGGNDYPVKEFGIDTIEVSNVEETKWLVRGILSTIS